MAEQLRLLSFTDIEIRSYLPSGWGLRPGASGTWQAENSSWAVEVYDGADHIWTVEVTGAEAARAGRLAALKATIERLTRKSLGRKSVITG
jgi:hypothetical protein